MALLVTSPPWPKASTIRYDRKCELVLRALQHNKPSCRPLSKCSAANLLSSGVACRDELAQYFTNQPDGLLGEKNVG